MPMVVTTI